MSDDPLEVYRGWQSRARYLEEYKAVMELTRDTGESIWLINGAYLVAVSVLAAMVAGALDKYPLLGSIGSIAGALICSFWYHSFRHNYRYYVLRIDYGRWLEAKVGFLVLRMGALLDQKGGPPDQKENPFGYFNDREKIVEAAIAIESLTGKPAGGKSIQGLTSRLIVVLGSLFGVLLGFSLWRMFCHHHYCHSWIRPLVVWSWGLYPI